MSVRSQPTDCVGAHGRVLCRLTVCLGQASLGALLAALAPCVQAQTQASSHCPCVEALPSAWATEWRPNASCQRFPTQNYVASTSSVELCYPADYGVGSCEAWDDELQPFCRDAAGNEFPDRPKWCRDKWCYVDHENCQLVSGNDATPTNRPSSDGSVVPHYSYATCGTLDNTFAKYNRSSLMRATEIVTTITGYVTELRDFIERQVNNLKDDSEGTGERSCPYTDGCACQACHPATYGTWMSSTNSNNYYSVDFNTLTVTHRQGMDKSGTTDERDTECLAVLAAAEFKRIGRLEYTDQTQMGFVMYGDQTEGIWFGWPGIDFCPTAQAPFDPRYRPWYVNAVSGPKDVVIILDRSGSMETASRWEKASKAASTVLDTLTEFDFATIVRFGTDADSFHNEKRLWPVSTDIQRDMRSWLTSTLPIGGTDMRQGFREAFTILDSRVAGSAENPTSGCNTLVLFLTDGEDTSGISAEDVSEMNTDAVPIFTYSFGAGAAVTLPKAIACSSKGVWQQVSDDGDIAAAMSDYYSYYAVAPELSQTKAMRWREYNEITTNNELISGCLPVYDRVAQPAMLMGVVCMDATIIISARNFREKPDYFEARARMQDESKRCLKVSHAEAELETLRLSISERSQCSFQEPNAPGSGSSNSSNSKKSRISFAWLSSLAVFGATILDRIGVP